MTYSPEKLLQLEFLVKTITQCRLQAENNTFDTSIGIRIPNHSEQWVCNIPKTQSNELAPVSAAVPQSDDTVLVTTVNVGKVYTIVALDSKGSCNLRPVSLSIVLYRLQNDNTNLSDSELASGKLLVKPTMLADVGCRPATTDKDDHIVPMKDCQGQNVAILSVRVRAWIAGTVMASPIDSPSPCPPPLIQSASIDVCNQKKLSESCNNLFVCKLPQELTPSYNKPLTPESTSCFDKSPTRESTSCCDKLQAQQSTSSCNKLQNWELSSGCNKPPAQEPTPCCKKPLTRELMPCCKRQPTQVSRCKKLTREQPLQCRRQCGKTQYSGMSRDDRKALDRPHRQYTDIGCEINGRKIDLRVRKKHCEPCDAERQINQDADKFLYKVLGVVRDMHEFIKDTVNIVD